MGKKVRAQPIGISAAPNMAGQARGRGKEWPSAMTNLADGGLFLPADFVAVIIKFHFPTAPCRTGTAAITTQ